MNIRTRFDKFVSDFLKFDLVKNKRSNRADLHAFIILADLDPTRKGDIIAGAEHDEIFLDFDLEDLENVSDDVICDLVRCGVRVDEYDEGLCMFA